MSRPASARDAFLETSLDGLREAAAVLINDRNGISAAMGTCGKGFDGMTEQDAMLAFGSLALFTHSEPRLMAAHGLTREQLGVGWAAIPQQVKDRIPNANSQSGPDSEDALNEAMNAFARELSLPAAAVAEDAARETFASYILGRLWRTRLTG